MPFDGVKGEKVIQLGDNATPEDTMTVIFRPIDQLTAEITLRLDNVRCHSEGTDHNAGFVCPVQSASAPVISLDSACCEGFPATFSVSVFDGPPQPWSPFIPTKPPACRCPDTKDKSNCKCKKGNCDCPVPVLSDNPIRYATGEIALATTDFEVNGFGVPWGHTRSFYNRFVSRQTLGNGFNWTVEEWPFLVLPSETTVVAHLPREPCPVVRSVGRQFHRSFRRKAGSRPR